MALIKFVRNHNDMSTDSGFQFEFYCDRCNCGFQTHFEASPMGMAAEALGAAGNMLGGLFAPAAALGERAKSATWEKAHDVAFQNAVNEARPYFKQCRRCTHWVDDVCWNGLKGMCKDCAPDLEAEYAAAQTEAAIMQAREKAQEASYVTAEQFNKNIAGGCANCGCDTGNGKFCPECGTPVVRVTNCTSCGCDTQGGKFCPECGTKQ